MVFSSDSESKKGKRFDQQIGDRGRSFCGNENGIEKVILEFFKNLYSKDEISRPGIQELNWCPISESKASWLERPLKRRK